MFTMIPDLPFGRRSSLWWSCVWHQTLATLPTWLIAGAILLWSALRAYKGESNWLSEVGVSTAALVLVISAGLLVASLLTVPILGYMARRGFARHGLSVPPTYSFGQAVVLGLTTWGWTLLMSLAVNLLCSLVGMAIGESPVAMFVQQIS